MTPCIDIVIVTYNPNIELLIKAIDSVASYVREVIVVDNKSYTCNVESELSKYASNLVVIACNDNLGIACAQNLGINHSLRTCSDYILLADQDTIFPSNYFHKMISVFERTHKNVVAVAPLFYDTIGQKNHGFFVPRKIGYSKIFPIGGLFELEQAIASGLILKSSLLNNTGLMDSELFIDWVDYEWCWRARSRGLSIIGNADVMIFHNLGDYSISVGNKQINLRNPERHYYITRNAFYLSFYCPHITIYRRFMLFSRGLLYIVGFSILAEPRKENLKMTLLGLYHSIIKRLGKLV